MSIFSGKPLSEEIKAKMKKGTGDRGRNTSISDYVWLPFVFDGDVPTLPWRDSWSLDEFEDA